MAFDEKKLVGSDALSELSTKVKTELDKKTDKAGALTNVSYDTTNKKFTKTTQGAHDPVTTDIVTTSTLKADMGIADFDGTFNSLKNKPTTISGYGITDAKVQNSTVTIGSNSVTALTQEDVSSTYDSSGTSPVDGKAVAAALGTLDVESVGGAGKYISAISETDGKISATAETMDSTPTSSSTKAVTSDGIYEYVNSSVATNTAYFIGTFDSVEELEAYSGIITNNDYAFVTSTDSSGNTLYNRYKYNGSTHTWSFEYALNNSSFTSAQWATIQSGLTSSDKTKLDGIQSGANKTIVDAAMSSSSTNPVQNKVVNTALAGKQDTLTFDSTPTQSSTNPVTSAGIYTDQARQDTLEAQDRAALIEVVDAGAKNVAKTTTISFTTSMQIELSPITGIVVLSAQNIASDDTSASQCAVVFNYSDGTSSEKVLINRGDNVSVEKTLGKTAIMVTLYASDTTAHSTGKTATFTDIMICTLADWNISHKYVPYKQDITWGLGDKIPQNSDFNSYIIPGVYRVENSTDAATMLHIPVTTDGGRLEVSIGDTSTEILHTYFSGNAEYRRSYNGSVWSDWVQILSTATLDEIPTANSTNAVMSGGVWTDQQRQETEIGVVANAGAKNIAPVNSGSGTSVNLFNRSCFVPAGNYILSYKASDFSGKYEFAFYNAADTYIPGGLNGSITATKSVEFTLREDAYRMRFSILGTATITDLMIRPAAITDPTFQPYARSNPSLTAEMDYVANAGAKNLLNFDAWKDVGVTRCTKTISGNSITITSTGDDSFTWYIAESATVQYPVAARIPVEAGKTYRLSWTANNNNKLNHAIYGNGTTGRPDNVVYRGEGSGYLDYTAASDVTFITFRLGLYDSGKTTTFSNVMIRPAVITDPTFQPYAKTNRELTVLTDEDRAALVELVDGSDKNKFTKTSDSVSSTGSWSETSGLTNITAGIQYVMSFENLDSSDTDSTTIQIRFSNPDLSYELYRQCQRGQNVSVSFTPQQNITNVRVYKADSYAHGDGDTMSFSGAMICTKAAWDVSHTYEPYALPNPILTPALIKQVDDGAKNLVNAPSGSNIRFINIPIVLQPGDYYVLFQNVSSTDTDATTCQFGAFAADDSQASNYPQLSRGNYTASMFTVTKQTAYVRIYASNNFASGANDTVTFTGCMICTAADWNISQAYGPYAPTNRELYETCETKVTMQQIYGIPPVSIIPAEGETADLNDYVTPGTYLVATSTLATRIINAPFSDKGYKIEVEQYRSGTYYKQTIFPWTEPGTFYTRTRAGGATWSAWYKFEGTIMT